MNRRILELIQQYFQKLVQSKKIILFFDKMEEIDANRVDALSLQAPK